MTKKGNSVAGAAIEPFIILEVKVSLYRSKIGKVEKKLIVPKV